MTEWIKIVLSMQNPYDFREYQSLGGDMGWVLYAQRVQALLWALEDLPHLPADVAYAQYVSEYGFGPTKHFKPQPISWGAQPPVSTSSPCGSCGGRTTPL